MSEIIEKVAMAIWRVEYFDCEEPTPGELKEATVQARAAIEALHKPTEKMNEAGVHAYHDEGPLLTADGIDAAWRAMITAALKE